MLSLLGGGESRRGTKLLNFSLFFCSLLSICRVWAVETVEIKKKLARGSVEIALFCELEPSPPSSILAHIRQFQGCNWREQPRKTLISRVVDHRHELHAAAATHNNESFSSFNFFSVWSPLLLLSNTQNKNLIPLDIQDSTLKTTTKENLILQSFTIFFSSSIVLNSFNWNKIGYGSVRFFELSLFLHHVVGSFRSLHLISTNNNTNLQQLAA